MACGFQDAGGGQVPCRPHQSSGGVRVQRLYPEFDAVLEQRYQER